MCLHLPRKIFGGAPDADEGSQETEQDAQGPSMHSHMDTERLGELAMHLLKPEEGKEVA